MKTKHLGHSWSRWQISTEPLMAASSTVLLGQSAHCLTNIIIILSTSTPLRYTQLPSTEAGKLQMGQRNHISVYRLIIIIIIIIIKERFNVAFSK